MADTKISDLAAVTDVQDTDEFVIARAGASKKLDGSDLLLAAGGIIAYTEFTSSVSVTATSEASPTDVVSSGAVSYTGVPIRIEFFAPIVEVGTTANSYVIVCLWDDTTNLGRMGVSGHSALSFLPQTPFMVARYLTPSAGTHTYKIRAFRSTSNGSVGAGAGGDGITMPGYICVTTAPA